MGRTVRDISCEHYFGRVVKSAEGIPCDYEYGCLEGHDVDKECGILCPGYVNFGSTRSSLETPSPRCPEYTGEPESAVVTIRGFNDSVCTGQLPERDRDRYEGRQFHKDYGKKKKACRRRQKQARRNGRK